MMYFLFKSIVAPGCVSLSAFEIRPAVFELNKGEMTTLEILFSPTQVESYAETLTMVCDNCQVKHFNVTGKFYWQIFVSSVTIRRAGPFV